MGVNRLGSIDTINDMERGTRLFSGLEKRLLFEAAVYQSNKLGALKMSNTTVLVLSSHKQIHKLFPALKTNWKTKK